MSFRTADPILKDVLDDIANLVKHATGKTVPGRDSEETVKAYGGTLAA